MNPLQWFLSALMVVLLIAAFNSRLPRCPREKYGYSCRRGTGITCECENKP